MLAVIEGAVRIEKGDGLLLKVVRKEKGDGCCGFCCGCRGLNGQAEDLAMVRGGIGGSGGGGCGGS